MFLASIVVSANAQITITESDYIGGPIHSEFNATQSSFPALEAIVSASGANQTWDFTVATFTPGVTDTIVSYSNSSGIPFANDTGLQASTNVFNTNDSTFLFYKITSSGSWALGISSDSAGTPRLDAIWSPPIQEAAFPMTYQETWSTSSNTTIPGAPGAIVTKTNSIVDGWGTLITPGHSTPALRVKAQNIEGEMIQGVFIGLDTGYSYNWWTAGGYYASISTESSVLTNYVQTIQNANYSVSNGASDVNENQSYGNDGLSLYLNENPASNATASIIYTLPNGGPVQVELMDELGRTVRMLQNGIASAGRNVIAIEPQALPAGTYFVRVTADGMSAMQKLLIAK